jgi:hypothetical protein
MPAMLWRDRLANYRHQNGTKKLTPKQQRRLNHKKNHRAATSRVRSRRRDRILIDEAKR